MAQDREQLERTGLYSYAVAGRHKIGRIAQSVERWSNKPLVKGSSPFVTTFVLVFFVVVGVGVYVAGRTCTPTQRRIRGRAVKALRSGRSPL